MLTISIETKKCAVNRDFYVRARRLRAQSKECIANTRLLEHETNAAIA
ncbi:MAG: hypothetical protein O6927_03145 [Gammaproteobacteria bacterium]|nr:hypothetical protein [Gammaproteobacteria bacterium]